MIIVNDWKPLTFITKSSILDAAAVLDPPLSIRPMAIKFGKQLHLEELHQMRLMKQVLATPSRQDHVTN